MESPNVDHTENNASLVSTVASCSETAGTSTMPALGSQPASVRSVAEPPDAMVPSKSGFKLKIFQGGGLRLAPTSAAPRGDQQFFFRQLPGGQPQLFMFFKDNPHKLYHIQAANGQELNIKLTAPLTTTTKAVPAMVAAGDSESRAGAKFVVTKMQQPAGEKTTPTPAPGKVTYHVVAPPGSAARPGLKVVLVRDRNPGAAHPRPAAPRPAASFVVRRAHPGAVPETQQAVSLLSGKTVPLDQDSCNRLIIPPKNSPVYKNLVKNASAITPASQTDVTGDIAFDGYVTGEVNTIAETSDFAAKDNAPPAETNTAETDNESDANDDDAPMLKIDSVFSLAPDSSQEQASSEQSHYYAHGASEDRPISVEDFYRMHCYTQEEMIAMCGLSFVVLERLSARAARQRQPSHYGCSHYCRQRTLNFLCMAGLIKCPTKYKPTLFKQEVDDSSSEYMGIKQEKERDRDISQTRCTAAVKSFMRFNLPNDVSTEEQENVKEESKNGSVSDPHLNLLVPMPVLTNTQQGSEPASVGESSPLAVRENSADAMQSSCSHFQRPVGIQYNLESHYDESLPVDDQKRDFVNKKSKSDTCDFAVQKHNYDVKSLLTALNSPIICPTISETTASITSTAAPPLSVSPNICPSVVETPASITSTAAAPLSVSPNICPSVVETTVESTSTASAPLSVSISTLPATVSAAIFRRPAPDATPASAYLQFLARQGDPASKNSISESTMSTTVTSPVVNQESAPGLRNLVGLIVNNTQADGKPMLLLLPLAQQGESAVIGSQPKVTSDVQTAGTAAKPLVLTATPLVPTLTPGQQPNSNLVIVQKPFSLTVPQATAPALAHPHMVENVSAHHGTIKADVNIKNGSAASLVSPTAVTTLPASQAPSAQNLPPKTHVIAPAPSVTKPVASMVSILSAASRVKVSTANSVGQASLLSGSSVRDVAAIDTTGPGTIVPQCAPGTSRIKIIPTSVGAFQPPQKKNVKETRMVSLVVTQDGSRLASGVDNETNVQSTISACNSVQQVNQSLVTATPGTSPLTSSSTTSVVKAKLASLLTSPMPRLTDTTDMQQLGNSEKKEICERKKSQSELERKYPLPPGVVIKTEGEAEFGCPTGPDVTWEEIDDLPLTFALPLQTDQEAEEERLRIAGVIPERSTGVSEQTDAEPEIPLDLESSEAAILDDNSDEQEGSTELECPRLDGPAFGATAGQEEEDSVYGEPPVLQPISPIPPAIAHPSGPHQPDPASFHPSRKRKHDDVTSEAKVYPKASQKRGPRTKARKTAGQTARQISLQERENAIAVAGAMDLAAATENSLKRVAAKAKDKHCRPAAVDAEPWPMTPPPSLSASTSSLTSSSSGRSHSTSMPSAAPTSAKSAASDRIQQLKEMLRQQNEALEQIRLIRAAQPPLCLEDFSRDSR